MGTPRSNINNRSRKKTTSRSRRLPYNSHHGKKLSSNRHSSTSLLVKNDSALNMCIHEQSTTLGSTLQSSIPESDFFSNRKFPGSESLNGISISSSHKAAESEKLNSPMENQNHQENNTSKSIIEKS